MATCVLLESGLPVSQPVANLEGDVAQALLRLGQEAFTVMSIR